jgi:DNA polymerase-1
VTELAAMARAALDRWQQDQPEVIGVDTETEGVAFYDRAFCVTFAWPTPRGFESHYIEIMDEDYSDVARIILMGTPKCVFHHAKFDLHKLLLAGIIGRHEIKADRFEDTEALAHLADEHQRKGLKYLAREYLGESTDEEKELKAAMRKAKLRLEEGYHLLPREVLIPYAKKDPELTLRLYSLFRPEVEKHSDLWGLYLHEKEVTLTLLDMERRGLRIDLDYVNGELGRLSSEVMSLEQRIEEIVGKPIGKNAETEFNPASNPQLAVYFTSKGYESDSYDKHFLKDCPDPLAQVLTEYRSAVKLKNVYFLAIRDEQRDGILHPHYRQHGTVTGRMSSGSAQDD